MKTKLILLTLTLSVSAMANEELDSFCIQLEKSARQVMTSRQVGVPLVDMIEVVKNHELSKSIVIEAYKRPMFSVETNKQHEIDNFANEYYLACLEMK